jgi:hypothetical protein
MEGGSVESLVDSRSQTSEQFEPPHVGCYDVLVAAQQAVARVAPGRGGFRVRRQYGGCRAIASFPNVEWLLRAVRCKPQTWRHRSGNAAKRKN